MKNKWKKRSGEGYIDTCVLILCAMLVIALAVKVLPVYVAKQQLDTFAARAGAGSRDHRQSRE